MKKIYTRKFLDQHSLSIFQMKKPSQFLHLTFQMKKSSQRSRNVSTAASIEDSPASDRLHRRSRFSQLQN